MEQNRSLAPLKTVRKSRKNRQKILFLTVMLAIPVLNWAVFWLYTNISTILLAFQSQRTGEWSLETFGIFWEQLTSPFGEVGLALRNTLIYFAANLLIILPVSLFIAFFIYKKILFYKGFRIIFYLPAIISAVAMATVFSLFIDPRGPLGVMCAAFGITIPPEGLLGRVSTATPTIVVYTIWTGFCTNILLISGAMTRIPLEILESAKLEGCGPFREIASIILPLIWPTLSTMIILVFTQIYASGGPNIMFDPYNQYKTTTLSYWIFTQVYGTGSVGGSGSYNLVSCAGLFFTAVGVPIILLTRWLTERVPAVEY